GPGPLRGVSRQPAVNGGPKTAARPSPVNRAQDRTPEPARVARQRPALCAAAALVTLSERPPPRPARFPMSRLRLFAALVLLSFLLPAAPARAGDESPFPDGKHGAGELKHVNGVPVLVVQGTPEEMGQQAAALIAKPAQKLVNFPKELFKREGVG